ncbi:MAG: hypothetical protein CL878_07785 [Dehalococcoidia bacterium]|nr:hypothetical protein [Dehalococcoidia bacterium]
MAKATAILQVRDLHCDGCAMTVTRALYQQPGVLAVQPDVPERSILIEYEPSNVTPATLRRTVEDVGFTVAPVN